MTVPVIIVIPSSIFIRLPAANTAISYIMYGKANGVHVGQDVPFLPQDAEELKAGRIVEFHLLLPPGVSILSAYTQFASAAAQFRVDQGPWADYELPIYQGTPVTQARFVSYALRNNVDTLIESIAFNFTIADRKLYDAWIATWQEPEPTPESREERLLRLITLANFAPAVLKFAEISDSVLLEERALQSGLWDSLLNLVDLAIAEPRK